MRKGERISRFVEELASADDAMESARPRAEGSNEIADHPCYRGFFRCWNEQRYYEAHDVLEHLWLKTTTDDWAYFKGLIQAAGAFVHLQKHFEHPTHRVHGRRLGPAVRLFRLAEKNLKPFAPMRHRLDLSGLLARLRQNEEAIVTSEFTRNPWSPETAFHLELSES